MCDALECAFRVSVCRKTLWSSFEISPHCSRSLSRIFLCVRLCHVCWLTPTLGSILYQPTYYRRHSQQLFTNMIFSHTVDNNCDLHKAWRPCRVLLVSCELEESLCLCSWRWRQRLCHGKLNIFDCISLNGAFWSACFEQMCRSKQIRNNLVPRANVMPAAVFIYSGLCVSPRVWQFWCQRPPFLLIYER